MADAPNPNKDNFLYPIGKYRGEFTPEQLAFNANLQEFAQRISLICGLETGGKITSDEAYHQIKDLWKNLKLSKKELLDQARPDLPELPEDEEEE
jgi:polyhydroxyalkanoate synthesis regulator phasin